MSESEMKSEANETNGTSALGMPWFEFPKNVFPANAFSTGAFPNGAFADIAQRGVAQVQERCDKIKAFSAELTEALSETYANNARGATDYGLKLIEISNANAASAIDFVSHVLDSRSVTDVLSISAAEARKAFDSAAERNRELFELAHKLAERTGEPIRKHVASALQRAS